MGPIQSVKVWFAFNKLEAAWNKTLWRTSLMGWKAVTGALIVALSGGLKYMESEGLCSGCGKIGDGIFELGVALGIWGLRHAQAKAATKVIALAAFLGLAATAHAQQDYSALVSANFYAEDVKHPSGSVSLLIPLDAEKRLFSFTSLEVRGLTDEQPVQSTRTGLATRVGKIGPALIYGLANGGVAASSEATSGDFAAGGAAVVGLHKQLQVVLGWQWRNAPTAGGWHRQPFIGLRLGD